MRLSPDTGKENCHLIDFVLPQKKDYEVALLGALRRERDKDTALQALTVENQAAMQLVCEKRTDFFLLLFFLG